MARARCGPDEADPHRAADDALALWVLHELSYRGFTDVDERWEWHPDLMTLRWRLEGELEQRLRKRMPATDRSGDLVTDLERVIADDDGPSLARHLQRHGSEDQALDLLRQRSLYHLKEADPTIVGDPPPAWWARQGRARRGPVRRVRRRRPADDCTTTSSPGGWRPAA